MINASHQARRLLTQAQGASAVEFALVAPLFFLLLFGCISYAALTATTSAVQQLVAEAARATVGGLSDSERDQLARGFVTANAPNYAYIDPGHLSVSTGTSGGTAPGFRVTVSYDLSSSFIYGLAGLIMLPQPLISRSAVVQTTLF